MFDLIMLIFGEYAIPGFIAFVVIVVVRTAMAVAADVDKRLVILASFVILTASQTSVAQDYDPVRNTYQPWDVSDAPGEWGNNSTELGELKLIREIVVIQAKLTCILIGVCLAGLVAVTIKRDY